MKITESVVEKINNGRFPVGVTGSIGCGKTYACKTFQEIASNDGITSTHIDVDSIRRNILGTDARYEETRSKVATQFGSKIANPDGSICTKDLGQIIFSDAKSMSAFKKIINPAIKQSIEYAINEKNGLLFVEWACLVEDGLLSLVDGNVLVALCNYDTQVQRLSGGDLDIEQVHKRMLCQLGNSEKISQIKSYQEKNRTGHLYLFDTASNPSQDKYTEMLEKIIYDLK